MFAVGIIIVWAITGPLLKFSDTWQLVINTGTTIIGGTGRRDDGQDAPALPHELEEEMGEPGKAAPAKD